MIDLTNAQLDALLKRLHLANARRAWGELVQRAEREEELSRFPHAPGFRRNRPASPDADCAHGPARALSISEDD